MNMLIAKIADDMLSIKVSIRFESDRPLVRSGALMFMSLIEPSPYFTTGNTYGQCSCTVAWHPGPFIDFVLTTF